MKTPFLLFVLLSFQSLSAGGIDDWTPYERIAGADGATIEELSTNITKGFNTDLEKAAAIYFWVTHNVAYDVKLMGKMLQQSQGVQRLPAAEVLKIKKEQAMVALTKRKGVCQNYARLYRHLAMAAKLECEVIAGHSRSYSRQVGTLGNGHAWNAVKIDEEWRLLDCTWGAGGVNAKQKFLFKFRPGYFLPNPGGFSYSHFPTDPEWQLLEAPLSESDYLGQPGIGVGFLEYGISDLNYNTQRLNLKRGNPLEIIFLADRKPENIICANLTISKQIPCTLTEQEGRYVVTIEPKLVRNMQLGLLTGEQETLVSYRLSVK